MEPIVIASKIEQEYLLRIIEASSGVRDLRQFFLWSQGQLQALLPHRLMVCMQFDPEGALLRLESMHGGLLDAATARLCDPDAGLALRLARRCSAAGALPCIADVREPRSGALTALEAELGELAGIGVDNLVLHGSGPVAGGSTVFALFGLPMKPGPRHAYFLDLLLPHLHLALVRLARRREGALPATARALSRREIDIMRCLREGKRNAEIGLILGISALTVKNHLQRIYKLLGVRSRGEAVARCAALPLPGAPAP